MEFIAENGGDRLDKFLAQNHKSLSRARFQQLIRGGAIKVNGKLVKKTSLRLKKGDLILILKEEALLPEKKFVIEPEPDINLKIVYEDKNLLVINKQPNLIVHPTLNQRHHTLVNALIARYPKLIGVGESPLRPGIVHRLDKDTSGLIIVAKNQETFFFLKNQFLNHSVKKVYLALVEGAPKEKEGVIKFQIRPSKSNRFKRVAIIKEGTVFKKKSTRTAETFYKIKEKIGKEHSLLEVSPKTGRTHQIRVHLAAIGHPVVGDLMYGAKKGIANRQMLHAYNLKFTSLMGKEFNLKIKIPKDMAEIIKKLKGIRQ